MNRVTNREVLRKCGMEAPTLAENIRNRKRRYIAHKIREEGLFNFAL